MVGELYGSVALGVVILGKVDASGLNTMVGVVIGVGLGVGITTSGTLGYDFCVLKRLRFETSQLQYVALTNFPSGK